MSKTVLLLIALTGLALAMPGAQAQVLGSSLAISLGPPSEHLTHGTTLTTTGTITYVTDTTAAVTNVNGVVVQYVVTNAPSWLTVTVSPAVDVLTFPVQPGVTIAVSKSFAISLEAAPNMTEEDVGTVEITAIATPTAPQTPARSAKATIPVHLDAAEPCDRHADGNGHAAAPAPTAASASDAPTLEAAAPAADAPAPVTIQQASTPIAPASYLAIGGFAAAGAGAGFLLRRRA